MITTAPTHIPRIQKSSQFKFVLITSRTSGMHSTNDNSENSEIGAISEFSECTVGRPLTHRKLQPAVWMESPVVYSEDGWPLLGSTPLGSQMSAVLRTPRVFEKKLACSACSHFCQTSPILEKAMAVAPRVPNQIRNLKCGMFAPSGGDSNSVGRRTASTQKPQPNSKHRNSKASKS